MNRKPRQLFIAAIIILMMQACNLPSASPTPEIISVITEPPVLVSVTDTPVVVVQHQVFPISASVNKLFYDVESASTAPERRAPFGDSYDINRLERPFLQDMTYVSDLDIDAFSLNKDTDWFYISLRLIGKDPNNSLGIHYGVEFDKDLDGFGDIVLVATPPYHNEWKTESVKVYADQNHNSAGLSSARSDAPFSSDGYETLLFDGSLATNPDPDVAWVRINADANATVQFAVKRSLIGNVFMYGTFADAGLKDIQQLDYVDRFTEEEAGSPVIAKKYYPLKALFAVDNTCQEAYGFKPSGYEPKLCPYVIPATPKPGSPPPTQVTGCQEPYPGYCPYGWAAEPYCLCIPG